MRIYVSSTAKGFCSIDFCVDHNKLETWFDVSVAIYSTPEKDGFYKNYRFATLKTAKRKFDYLTEKYGI